jgi:hypothetical protein
MAQLRFAARRSLQSRAVFIAVLLLISAWYSGLARAAAPDQVLEWNAIMNTSVLTGGSNPLVAARVAALVSGAVFDAVNGIDHRYRSLHVRPGASHPASQRAAAVQAAYAMLVMLYPLQQPALAAQRDADIAALSTESATAVRNGVAWGQSVAESIFAWRSNDGLMPPPPPFLGVLGIEAAPNAVGVWRPTPVSNLSGAGPQFATMTPWVLKRPSQFRVAPPLALTSPEYAADYNEVKVMGVLSGSGRTDDQSEFALFWTGNTPLYWNRIAAQVAATRSRSLVQNAHLLASVNVSMADAAIACWDSKYRYVTWRPITAIQEGDRDGNAATAAEPAWVPWLDTTAGTPPHPEYPSGHSTVSGAAAFVLAHVFGDETAFTVTSEARPGTRSFASFSAALAEINDARVFAGIHFRTSCVRANALGATVARYVLTHAMRADDEDEH